MTAKIPYMALVFVVVSNVSAVEWIEYPVPTLAEAAGAAEVIVIVRVVSGESGELATAYVGECIKGTAVGETKIMRKYMAPSLAGDPDPEYFIFRNGKEYCLFCADKGDYYEPYYRWNTLWAVARVENGVIDLSAFADELDDRWVELDDFNDEVARANGWK
ncbi:MAG: hypothetical protein JSW52_06690 [Candidatus Coatesbacteria bacterium]|nr:MAG: hypothetical protein JSW52_06690 [Candidatus Coatesbacteria bacterium]